MRRGFFFDLVSCTQVGSPLKLTSEKSTNDLNNGKVRHMYS